MTFEALWYRPHPARWLLWPLSLIYGAVVSLRRTLYRRGWFRSERLPVPVIVVGNITVGGTGKTPLVIWLVEQLRKRGWKPGIVSRGYGGSSKHWPRAVLPGSNPSELGDEPVLLAQRLNCPIVVGPRRVENARQMLAQHDVDIVVSDDGLQHYALQRDIEIAVVDGRRGLGNNLLLPAGPLREPASRLEQADCVLLNDGVGSQGLSMELRPTEVVRLDDSDSRPLSDFVGKPVHAIAAIGNPERFFDALRDAGLQVRTHAWPDHHPFRPADIDLPDTIDVIMTEKDAVKCRGFATGRHWYLKVEAQLSAAAIQCLNSLIDSRAHKEKRHG